MYSLNLYLVLLAAMVLAFSCQTKKDNAENDRESATLSRIKTTIPIGDVKAIEFIKTEKNEKSLTFDLICDIPDNGTIVATEIRDLAQNATESIEVSFTKEGLAKATHCGMEVMGVPIEDTRLSFGSKGSGVFYYTKEKSKVINNQVAITLTPNFQITGTNVPEVQTKTKDTLETDISIEKDRPSKTIPKTDSDDPITPDISSKFQTAGWQHKNYALNYKKLSNVIDDVEPLDIWTGVTPETINSNNQEYFFKGKIIQMPDVLGKCQYALHIFTVHEVDEITKFKEHIYYFSIATPPFDYSQKIKASELGISSRDKLVRQEYFSVICENHPQPRYINYSEHAQKIKTKKSLFSNELKLIPSLEERYNFVVGKLAGDFRIETTCKISNEFFDKDGRQVGTGNMGPAKFATDSKGVFSLNKTENDNPWRVFIAPTIKNDIVSLVLNLNCTQKDMWIKKVYELEPIPYATGD